MNNLKELFLDELADIYDAEKQLVKALPKLAKAASSEELRRAVEKHLEQTEEHVRRVEQVFETFNARATTKKCKAMEGLIAEAAENLEEDMEPAVKDAALIAAAQKVEHYEMATYGTLRTWAELLEQDEAVSLLEEISSEEEETDDTLTRIAENVNAEANESSDEEAEEEHAHHRSTHHKAGRK